MDGRSNVNSFLRRKDNDQSHWRVDKEPKSPMDGQSKAKSSPQKEEQWTKSPTGGRSKVKSSPRRKNNDQSHL